MKRLPFALLLTIACRGEASPPAQPAALQHHDISASSMPRPFATKSAANPPRVVAPPANWKPAVPPGYQINLFASGFDDPRNMILAPNGDVLVADSSAGEVKIVRGNQVLPFARGLDYPYGLALRGNMLYIGESNAIARIAYPSGGKIERIATLPASGGHLTRNVIFNRDGSKMFVAIGSASNVNPEAPPRAAIMQFNPDGSGMRTFAYGLRNPIGVAWNPQTGALWTAVIERDGLGEDLVPDFITDVHEGAFYGWPYAYIGQHPDPRRSGERPDLVAKSIAPALLIASHSAPIAIVFDAHGDAFVALHGSWNRARRTGYKVIRVPFRNGKPAGGYDDFAIGWMIDENSRSVYGRPAGLLFLADGSLLISDDGRGVIWRVSPAR